MSDRFLSRTNRDQQLNSDESNRSNRSSISPQRRSNHSVNKRHGNHRYRQRNYADQHQGEYQGNCRHYDNRPQDSDFHHYRPSNQNNDFNRYSSNNQDNGTNDYNSVNLNNASNDQFQSFLGFNLGSNGRTGFNNAQFNNQQSFNQPHNNQLYDNRPYNNQLGGNQSYNNQPSEHQYSLYQFNNNPQGDSYGSYHRGTNNEAGYGHPQQLNSGPPQYAQGKSCHEAPHHGRRSGFQRDSRGRKNFSGYGGPQFDPEVLKNIDVSRWKNAEEDMEVPDEDCVEIHRLSVSNKGMLLKQDGMRTVQNSDGANFKKIGNTSSSGKITSVEGGSKKLEFEGTFESGPVITASAGNESDQLGLSEKDFKVPVQISYRKGLSYYSRDDDLNLYIKSARSSRFYNRPKTLKRHKPASGLLYNLFEGWENYKPYVYNRSVPRLTGTLKVLASYEKEQLRKLGTEDFTEAIENVDFISNKGPLVKIMSLASPVIARFKRGDNPIDLNICTVGNTIIMSNNKYREVSSFDSLRNAYLGHKFEQVVSSEKHPSEITDWEQVDKERFITPKTNNSSFKMLAKIVLEKQPQGIEVGDEVNNGTVFKADVDKQPVSMIVSSEADCRIKKNRPVTDLSNYCELKCSHINGLRGDILQKKLYLAYLQCNFTGGSKVVIGARSNSGELLSLREYNVRDIPGMLNPKKYDIDKSHEFLHETLRWIKANVEFGKEGKAVWRLKYDVERKELVLRKIENEKYVEKITRYVYPETFIEHRKELSQKF